MFRVLRRPVIFAVVPLALATGCGSASKSASPTTTTPATTTAPATTAAPTTTVPAKATVGFPSSDAAAAHLVDAWMAHDRVSAAQGADQAAVDGIFATPDASMFNRGCALPTGLPEGGCIYRTPTGLVQINTEQRPIGWVVVSAIYEPS